MTSIMIWPFALPIYYNLDTLLGAAIYFDGKLARAWHLTKEKCYTSVPCDPINIKKLLLMSHQKQFFNEKLIFYY
jgi:hypothetical protein